MALFTFRSKQILNPTTVLDYIYYYLGKNGDFLRCTFSSPPSKKLVFLVTYFSTPPPKLFLKIYVFILGYVIAYILQRKQNHLRYKDDRQSGLFTILRNIHNQIHIPEK